MITYPDLQSRLLDKPGIWLVTGVAGFIGSHLLEALLQMDQHVIGLDNLSTGRRDNLDSVRALVTQQQWSRFQFRYGDISSLDDCRHAMMFSTDSGETHLADYVLHQAALCSVARSIEDPALANDCNINGFLNILVAARDAGVTRLVYASSSAVYGDTPGLPKDESGKLRPLSPYAITKYVDELYADVFAKLFHLKSIGLRYFNVFGVRQDPQGAYAAVIPKWIDSMISANPVTIFGDGETSRDFCHVSNVVQANLLAAPAAASPLINYTVISAIVSSMNSPIFRKNRILPISGRETYVTPSPISQRRASNWVICRMMDYPRNCAKPFIGI